MNDIEIPGPLVSPSWVEQHFDNPRLVLLEATMGSGPTTGPTVSFPPPPGTKLFDFEGEFCDRTSALPHTIPAPGDFEREARLLGIDRESVIIVYDRAGIFASPRAWWMFKAMGHDQVAVLDGGMPAWMAKKLAARGPESRRAGTFVARPRPELICDIDGVAKALEDRGAVVLDARSEGRFHGREPEPRPGLRGGHMPGALNLHYASVMDQGRMLPEAGLRELFSSKAAPGQKMVFTCGSGVTACILALAAEIAGYPAGAVYDGSWSEWGRPSERPVTQE
jgi:thiosulfate/3-mercaptopyruvate sulfurtransferase